MVVQANTVQSIYIDNRNYPGGPWTYFLATQNLAVNVVFYAALFVLTFLTDMLVVSDPSTSHSVMVVLSHSNISYGVVGSSGPHLAVFRLMSSLSFQPCCFWHLLVRVFLVFLWDTTEIFSCSSDGHVMDAPVKSARTISLQQAAPGVRNVVLRDLP
jgi:hypothetical protein